VRAGIELLGTDQHVGVRFMCEPALALGSAWDGAGSTVGVVGGVLSFFAVVSLYGTGPVTPQRSEAPPARPAGDEVDDSVPTSPALNLAVCGRAYDHISALADAWTDWHPDREPLADVPSRQTFLATCGDLPDGAQLCLAMPYAKTHRAECVPVLEALPRRETSRLDALFLRSVPATSASASDAGVDLRLCGRLFDRIDEVAAKWVENHPGRTSRGILPSSESFFRVCTHLPDDAQICLNPTYEAAHHDQCTATLASLPPQDRAGLDGLFLMAPPGDGSSERNP
jgi:hypothetical protein